MNGSSTFLFAGAAAAATIAVPAHAQSRSELWTTVSGTTELSPSLDLYGEVVLRSEDELDGVRQLQLRTILFTPVTDRLKIGLGFVRTENSPQGRPSTFENTPFPQIDWRIAEVFGGELSSRTRMEFRFRSDGLDTSYRLRQRIGYAIPLGAGGPSLRLTEEAFFELADTGGRNNSGYSASRLSAGVRFKLNDHVNFEPGYLAEINTVRGGTDFTRHVLNLVVATSF